LIDLAKSEICQMRLYTKCTTKPKYQAMDECERLRRAFGRVKEFAEVLPNERVCWLELRAAVEKALQRRG